MVQQMVNAILNPPVPLVRVEWTDPVPVDVLEPLDPPVAQEAGTSHLVEMVAGLSELQAMVGHLLREPVLDTVGEDDQDTIVTPLDTDSGVEHEETISPTSPRHWKADNSWIQDQPTICPDHNRPKSV